MIKILLLEVKLVMRSKPMRKFRMRRLLLKVQRFLIRKISPVLIRRQELTSNYFCFDCGAVLTTTEDKKQHKLIENERKNQNDIENSD